VKHDRTDQEWPALLCDASARAYRLERRSIEPEAKYTACHDCSVRDPIRERGDRPADIFRRMLLSALND
jgi:hypothetical protein